MRTIRTGDLVLWRGGFGTEPPRPARVAKIERCAQGKYGTEVDEIDLDTTRGVLVLDNGHWCYGHQIDGLVI